MKRIENREILQQVRKETSEKIEKKPMPDFNLCGNRLSGRWFRGDL